MGAPLPDKLYFKIGEVARLAGVKPSVLRFWETEFAFLKPDKSSSGQRLYEKREVELILQVRQLLYDEKFTIEGAKKRISSKGRLTEPLPTVEEPPVDPNIQLLRSVKDDLQQLRNML